MTLKSPRETGPPDFDDECTKVGPPSGAVLDALRSSADPNVEPNADQTALDELVDLTVEFEESPSPTLQLQTVPYGAVLSPAPMPRPVFGWRSFVLVFLLTAAALLALEIGGSLLIHR